MRCGLRTPGRRASATPKPFAARGGAPCLDFCNSGQGMRGSRQEEWIPTYADLVDWLEAAGSLTESQALRLRTGGAEAPQAAQQLFERAIAFREALARVLLARTEGRAAAREDLRIIDAEYARTAPFARLSATDDGFAWALDSSAAELDAALRPLVESAVSLLTSERLARLRRCGNSTCYWLFLDETKNCSRRWGEMASCGNLMKVRRHRAAQRRSV